MADISRADALALIAERNGADIWQAAVEFSAALRTFRRINLGKKINNYPVAGTLPTASFVAGEDADSTDAIKPTTNMTWTDRTLTAEEIAGIVVIPENVIDDASPEFDLWAEVRPRIAEAVGITLDGAVFFGTGAPASWPVGLVPGAIAASNVYVEGTSAIDIAEDINQTIALVEADGFDATTGYARRTLRARLRGLRDDTGSPIWTTSLSTAGASVNQVYDTEVEYVTNGAWDTAEATLLVGDPNYAILGIRQDLTFKLLDQATVTIGGNLVSLAERDLIGLRFKMRVGFQTAEVATKDGGASAYPFAVLTPAGS
jgi:HK97 family phage major capsid protein